VTLRCRLRVLRREFYAQWVASLFKRAKKPVTVTMIGKPGCHLCDDARLVIQRVAAEFAEANDGAEVVVEEMDLTAEGFDPVLKEEYWEQIPVTLVNGARHDFWRVDPVRLRKAVSAASRG
jgi:hypothetical protein